MFSRFDRVIGVWHTDGRTSGWTDTHCEKIVRAMDNIARCKLDHLRHDADESWQFHEPVFVLFRLRVGEFFRETDGSRVQVTWHVLQPRDAANNTHVTSGLLHKWKRLTNVIHCTSSIFGSSYRMRVINHNWSSTKQRPHPQSVAEISRHYIWWKLVKMWILSQNKLILPSMRSSPIS